ncbi:non-heme iron oxygenase ferredoxin subunit [Marinomonas mediterranea]|jgi:Ferredoxin subunits of nitrite reductase and ring-hydroxylating dioxygenases|uniref:Rieske (2Fe-2S) iron-sulfur domain n=1 Tax=Marinomonas mediterranea (strain ATCC 700492 / JCM 21426 / NBRC 103028 / MMB-1) TaxID=717774 RepID=F2JUY9_MARM1|nr:non-heme iron oxygenase ferredoxin subunit [Marinomonas mediterranea]ADZ91643.1 Rieske (2Fe-2S) iron-sulfur domain [Marinomonas mediterranea MMB-1]WCN09601.1 Rieske 2Fe-2S domain-containing protein [Marinomonas mediterranea]WCN13689.1 Rieske 2Fe-2S domain-containing protein [Marinomonas mediterranea]WCN17744.1 Rieske 2Fe-2S domain-containing protein [Marinomonas mediterranea MMB-1]
MQENWIKTIQLDDIPEDDVIGINVEGHPIALYKVEDGVFATDNVCSHGRALLSDGFLEDGEIECPLHQGRFCIKSGKAMSEPLTHDITAYPTKTEGDQVFIKLG